MAYRKNVSGKRHARSFQKKRNRHKAINTPNHVARGGIRL